MKTDETKDWLKPEELPNYIFAKKEKIKHEAKAFESLAEERMISESRRLALVEIKQLLPGWRKVVAEIDDLSKPEHVGKAMWAVLNQMDGLKYTLAELVKLELTP